MAVPAWAGATPGGGRPGRSRAGRFPAPTLAARWIRVNCIAPETILTEGNQDQIPAELQVSLADAHPLKRLGTPQDVATVAAFLACDEAAWITGVVIDVAGGAVLV